jgi:hypothetical protein
MTQLLVAIGAIAIAAISFSSREFRTGWRPAFSRLPLLLYPVAAGVWPIVATVIGYSLRTANHPLSQDRLFALQFAPLLVVAVVIALTALLRGFTVVLLPTVAIVGILAAEAIGALALGQSWGHVLAAIVALAPALFVRREHGQLDILKRGVMLSLVLLATFLAVFAVLQPELALRPCAASGKCLLSDRALTVDFGAGSNVTGVTLALIAPAVAYLLRGWRGFVLPIPVLLIVVLSGSRTAMVAVVLGSALALLLRVRLFARRPWMIAVPVVLVGLVPVFVPFDAAAFTLRGNLWSIARGLIAESPLFGQGASFWIRNSATINHGLASYSPHNIWLALLVDLGVIGTLALVVATAFGYVRSSPEARRLALVFIFAILATGILEATALYQRLGPFPVGLLLAIVALAIGSADLRMSPAPPEARRVPDHLGQVAGNDDHRHDR